MASKVYKGCQRPALFLGVPIKVQIAIYLPLVIVFLLLAYLIDSPAAALLILVVIPLHMFLMSVEASMKHAWRKIMLQFKWSVIRMDRYSKSIGYNFYGAYGEKHKQKTRELP